jgi:hypothetical protein
MLTRSSLLVVEAGYRTEWVSICALEAAVSRWVGLGRKTAGSMVSARITVFLPLPRRVTVDPALEDIDILVRPLIWASASGTWFRVVTLSLGKIR